MRKAEKKIFKKDTKNKTISNTVIFKMLKWHETNIIEYNGQLDEWTGGQTDRRNGGSMAENT